jgi:putative membrane protein
MKVLGIALVLLVALEHLYFLYLEMFLWTTPEGAQDLRQHPEKAEASKVLAANQGLYNGFLAAGLLWGLVYPGAAAGVISRCFSSACVIVAGIYGGLTVSRRILYLQGGPALLALLVLLAGEPAACRAGAALED